MGKVVSLHPTADVAQTLRRIADRIDEGEFAGETATLILDMQVFTMGASRVDDERAVEGALFDMTWGTTLLMGAVRDATLS